MDVDQMMDWVVVHAVAIGAFVLLELMLWDWLSRHYAPEAGAKPRLLAFSLNLAVLLYAPLRAWSLRGMRKLTGRVRPSLAESLRALLERAQATGDPAQALEQTLRWALKPDKIGWGFAVKKYGELLDLLELSPESKMGNELGDQCPRKMKSAAWIPVQIDGALAATVLFPQGARGWSRYDLRIARALARSSEPLFEMRRIQLAHIEAQTATREQRDEMMREMHDGLGSQSFGASPLSNVSATMPELELHARFREVSNALSDTIDSLRTGLTVLSAPPGAFGPAALALLLRSERVLEAAGIALSTQVEDEAVTEIARTLGLSVKTVSTYRERILDTMNLSNNFDTIRYKLQEGLQE